MAEIDKHLKAMLENDGSDLHLSVNEPVKVRASGEIRLLYDDDTPVSRDQMEKWLKEIVTEDRWQHYLEHRDLDVAYEIEGLARFRCSYLFNHWGMAAVFRQIPAEILSFDKLKLPEILREVCSYPEGLVLVTGPTGSGKSTTLAAMIDYINSTSSRHIITIEDPVEFVHPQKQSIVIHREVGVHTDSFAHALRGAMRADPDVVLVGELRELDTIRLALNCASMGMLVFGTLHTNNAPKTIDRIIDAFPADDQAQIRVMLANCLACVVSQLLCKRQPKGRIAVHEILLKHDALPNTIRTGNIAAVRSIIENGTDQGMCLMDSSIIARFREGSISEEEAFMKAADKEQFKSVAAALREASGTNAS